MNWMDLFRGRRSDFRWKDLTSAEHLQQLIEASEDKPQLIFKHSTRCSISRMVKRRFEKEWRDDLLADIWMLDLLTYRPVSDGVAELLEVEHQSPQAILIVDGNVAYEAAHSSISAFDMAEILS